MPLTICEYRNKLINLVLCARCDEDAKRFVNASIKGLKEYKLNGHLILRFIERTLRDLDGFSPFNHDDRQRSNIKMAKMQLSQFKDAIHSQAQARQRAPSK